MIHGDINEVQLAFDVAIINATGWPPGLVDELVRRGRRAISVLDVSPPAQAMDHRRVPGQALQTVVDEITTRPYRH